MSKNCVDCGLSKNFVEIYNNVNTCKQCKIKRTAELQTKPRHEKKEDQNPKLMALITNHQKAHLTLHEPSSIHEKMIKYIEIIEILKRTAMDIADETIV